MMSVSLKRCPIGIRQITAIEMHDMEFFTRLETDKAAIWRRDSQGQSYNEPFRKAQSMYFEGA